MFFARSLLASIYSRYFTDFMRLLSFLIDFSLIVHYSNYLWFVGESCRFLHCYVPLIVYFWRVIVDRNHASGGKYTTGVLLALNLKHRQWYYSNESGSP